MSGNLHFGRIALFVSAVVAAAALPPRSRSTRAEEPQAVAAGPVIALQSLASGLGPMTFIANAGDARLFLVIQTGQILVYSGGSVLATPFLDLSGIITSGGERGLLSVAFHPQYASNGFFFVYYTNGAGNIEVARYKRLASDPNVADPSSGVVLLTIDHRANNNHNGGQLQFGPEGPDAYLYIGTGDGGAGNDPPCNAQNDDQPLGKLLRIDVDQNVNTTPFYGIPPSNPQALGAYPRNLTWAKGLRNPWRFSFDRLTGDLWIGDVGQSAREEIDVQPASSAGGENYGWKIMEGSLCGVGGSTNCPTSPAPPPCNSPLFKYPLIEYDHGGGRCSVTGGYVYRGSQDPALFGTYLYGDYCSGQIWGSGQLLTPTVPQLTTFGEDAAGELYIGTGGGQFFRIVHVAATPTPTPTPLPPTATPTPTPTPADSRSAIPLPDRHRPEPRPLAPRQPG
jgi:glucose/arabinose dehydrogenase